MKHEIKLEFELKDEAKHRRILFAKEEKFYKLFLYLLILSLIAGVETTLLLYSAEKKGLDLLIGLSASELGMMNYIINTLAMGALGLFVTFIVQIFLILALVLIFRISPLDIKGVCQSVINGGIVIVLGSGVNALIANLVNIKETTFTSLGLFIKEKDSLLFILMAECELFYVISLVVFGVSLYKLTPATKKHATLITIIIALISLGFHIFTYDSGTYLT